VVSSMHLKVDTCDCALLPTLSQHPPSITEQVNTTIVWK
jgi:hypothetical protein